MQKTINENAKDHQWECKRPSMRMRKTINGNANKYEWNNTKNALRALFINKV
jgi:hypothetical protein